MRILIAGANASTVGGAEMYQRSLAPALGAAGHSVAFLHERRTVPGIPRVAADDDIPSWSIGQMGQREALRAMTAWRPEILYVQGLTSATLEAELLDTHAAALFAHSYYGTCATGTKRHALPTVRFCERRLGNACLPLNYLRACGARRPSRLLREFRIQRQRLANLSGYRAVCVASEHMQREYRRHGVDAERLHVVRPPPSGIAARATLPATPAASGRVLLAGRLTRIKGGIHAVWAIDWAGRLLGRGLTLVVAGDGPARPEIERQAIRRGVRIELLGWLDTDQRNDLLRTVELALIPSLWPEPWGLVGIEAACVGVPAAGYASGGIPEWLVAGETGELAPGDPPRPERLADAIARALRDRDHYRRLSRGAWERAREYSMESHVRRLVPILARAAET